MAQVGDGMDVVSTVLLGFGAVAVTGLCLAVGLLVSRAVPPRRRLMILTSVALPLGLVTGLRQVLDATLHIIVGMGVAVVVAAAIAVVQRSHDAPRATGEVGTHDGR